MNTPETQLQNGAQFKSIHFNRNQFTSSNTSRTSKLINLIQVNEDNLKIFSSIATVGFSNYFPFSNKHDKVFEMKATEQYFPVVLFIMLYKVFLTFKSVHENLKCDHSNERY